MRKILLAIAVLAGLTACTNAFVNPANNERYRVLRIWPLLSHDDGSMILFQKANSSATFEEPTESSGACRPIVDHTWDVLDEMKNRVPDYRWLGK